MYRAPASNGGTTGFLMMIFILWGVIYLSGCTDTATGFEDVTSTANLEVELATDPDLTSALIEDVSTSMADNMTDQAEVEISTADSLFDEARDAFTRGEHDRVRSLGDRARDALGRALASGRDRSSLDDFIDRVRDVRRLLAAGDTADFDRPDDLARDVDRLLDDATAARDRGDDVTAGKRVIDAHRLTDRSRVRRHDFDAETHAKLVVGMADKAVELANRLLDGTVISERRQHLLDTAARLAAASAEAYENGYFRRAIILGHKAVGVSLTAVVRPDAVTDERIRALTDVASSEFQVIIDLAEAELQAARETLEQHPNEFYEKLLGRAVHAFETGVEHLREGHPRGIQLIWRAAVVGAVIAGSIA